MNAASNTIKNHKPDPVKPYPILLKTKNQIQKKPYPIPMMTIRYPKKSCPIPMMTVS